jgi:alanyl-tRNA synthetase
MGLERIAAVLQHVHSNYEIDLFQSLIHAAARETGHQDLSNNSLKVIADHIRACAFLVVDGVIPGNEGRGYVLRRIIRRAIRHGYKLGQKKPFFHRLVADLVAVMGEAYPELTAVAQRVEQVLRAEEERFAETLENGMRILEQALQREDRTLDGETVFQLYDTFGFPVDLTADIARERGVTFDMAGFEAAMNRQREQARAAGKFRMATALDYRGEPTEFVGYQALEAEATVVALYREGVATDELARGESGVVVLDRTPFYAESGGQVGDRGELRGAEGTFVVEDTQRLQAEVSGHHGVLTVGRLRVGDRLTARVDLDSRSRAAWNHSATHLMHAALRRVLGTHVQQRGSHVDAQRTRFDFSHGEALTEAQLLEVEAQVNREIRHNVEVASRVMKYDEAIRTGAMALFGEKYGDEVRVIQMGDYSTELCGGTHVRRTGDIGLFKVVAESGVAAGIRRIEAVTGEGALAHVQAQAAQLADAAQTLKAQPGEIPQRLAQMLESMRSLERELARLKSKLAAAQGDGLADSAVTVKGVKVLAATLAGADSRVLRETLDKVKDKLGRAVVVLAAVEGGRVSLVAGVTADLTARVKAGELVNSVAQQVGGKGGGRPDMAQAGGTDPSGLPQALAGVAAWVEAKL